MIEVKKSTNADTRTSGPQVKKEELILATKAHIEDVKKAAKFLSDKLMSDVKTHDYTKIEFIDMFYKDFIEQREKENKETDFKDRLWYKIHLSHERHHLNEFVPKDVNLIDLCHMAADQAMAAMARGGWPDFEKFPIKIAPEVFQKAFENTIMLLAYNTTIEGQIE